jgi:alpha-beta hydrolase superfamily lysophospholipase
MIERFARLPSALEKQTKYMSLGKAKVPALVAHPNWSEPAPVVLWMHGRTVDKSRDPGRYLRWIRGGIAACAVDLPGHGDRLDEKMQSPDQSLYVVEQMVGEIDSIVEALGDPALGGLFDLSRVGIGGMSAGGMATLCRLCDPHTFTCAAVESTIGDYSAMPHADRFPTELIAKLDPIRHLDGWRDIPLLALHSEKDEWAPVEGLRRFTQAVQAQQPTTPVEFITWPETGAPFEHAGFGNVANNAKNLQLAFFQKWLLCKDDRA